MGLFGPSEFDALIGEHRLKITQVPRNVSRLAGRGVFLFTKCDKGSSRFADIPFHRMETVAAVGNVGRADVFAGRNQVFHTLRDERTERNLKSEGRDVDIIVARRARMEVAEIGRASCREGGW